MELPKYRIIMEEIRSRIERGVYPPGTALPSGRRLATEFSTNHETANKAVSHLVAEGLLFRRRGIGTFVAEEQRDGEAESSRTIDILLYRRADDLFHAASFHEEIVFALQRLVLARGYASRIIPVLDVADFDDYCGHARAFIVGSFLPFRYLETIRQARKPIVALNLETSLPGLTCVTVENGAIELLCRHLVHLGHERIAFLRRADHSPSGDLREFRFKNAMRMMELPDNLDRIHHLDPEEDTQASRLVGDVRRCTAVVAADDFLAIKVHQLLSRYQVSVPRDLSVTGFGNLSLTKSLFPELTTADVDRDALCKTLVDEAFRMMDDASESHRITFESYPVYRRSTGPPASSGG